MRPGRDNRLGNALCSCTHPCHLVGAWWCTCTSRSASMPQPDPCRQLRVPECLAKADSSRCGTEESWKEPHGYKESAYKFSPSWILHVHFCQDIYCPGNGVFKFPDLREEDNTYTVLDSGAECAHTWCRMWKCVSYQPEHKIRQTTLWNSWLFLCDKRNAGIWWKVFSPKLDIIPECVVQVSSFPVNYQLPSLKTACWNAFTAGVKE